MERVAAPLCDRFRSECAEIWESLHGHAFIRELAVGTLPPEKFRFYVEQNLMYLPEYARTMALGAARAEGAAEMKAWADALANILDNEIPENRELLRRVIDLGAEDCGGALAMAPANVAYTGFLVSVGQSGGPVEIMAAIVPCTWSYGDIAARLAGSVGEHPVYAEWIRFFGSPEYDAIVDRVKRQLEELAAGADERFLPRLSATFRTSTRLERAFWDMAYGLVQWPDVAPRRAGAASAPR